MFAKFAETSPVVWGIVAALALLGVVLFAISTTGKKWTVRMLANAALCIALSFVLSYIRLYKMPQGGSITLASMLPVFMFAYAYGVGPGMMAGFTYGILQFIQDPYFVHPIELLLDYPLAYAMLGLAGLASRFSDQWGLIPGIAIGTFCRFLCAFTAGIVFFSSFTPEGQSVLVYSISYNGAYLIPEAIICIVLAMVPQVRKLAHQLALSK